MSNLSVWDILKSPVVTEKSVILKEDSTDEDSNRVQGVVCNPVIALPEGKDRGLEEGEECCLSLPGAFTKGALPG